MITFQEKRSTNRKENKINKRLPKGSSIITSTQQDR